MLRTPALLEQGISLQHIKKLQEHSSSKTTKIYTKVFTEKMSKIKIYYINFIKTKLVQYMPNRDVLNQFKEKYNGNINH